MLPEPYFGDAHGRRRSLPILCRVYEIRLDAAHHPPAAPGKGSTRDARASGRSRPRVTARSERSVGFLNHTTVEREVMTAPNRRAVNQLRRALTVRSAAQRFRKVQEITPEQRADRHAS